MRRNHEHLSPLVSVFIAGTALLAMAGCSNATSTTVASPSPTAVSTSAAPVPSGAGCAAAEKANHQQVVDALNKAEAAHAAWATYQGGDDADWATYYSAFLVQQSPLADLIDTPLTQASVTTALVTLDGQYNAQSPSASWQEWYANNLCNVLASEG